MNIYRLNELCSPKQWKTISSKNLLNNGFPVYGANGKIGFYSEYNHEKETILVTCRGATCGSVNICEPFSYVNGNAMALDNLNEEIVNIDYLFYYLKYRGFNDVISGSAQPQIILSGISKIKVPLPDMYAQKRVSNTIKILEDIIDKRQTQIVKIDELLQSLFLEMFGDPKINPFKWTVGTINDLTLISQYGTSKKADENSGDFPILRMNNITYNGNWDFSSMKYINLDEKERKKYLVNKGELLFNRTNSKELVGKTAVFRKETPMAFAGYLVKIVPNDKGNSEFISAFLNSAYGKALLLSKAKSIVGMANINAEELKNIPIYLPPKELQDKFASKIEVLLKHKDVFEKGLEKLKTLYNALLQKAFKGE